MKKKKNGIEFAGKNQVKKMRVVKRAHLQKWMERGYDTHCWSEIWISIIINFFNV